MIKRACASLAVLALAVPAALAAPAGDPEAGAAVAPLCLACHQADGSGMNVPDGQSWPRLAGLNAQYMEKQLHDFQNGSRSSVLMKPFADMLDDKQKRDVSAYYAGLPATAAAGGEGVAEEVLALGERLALRGDWERYIVPCRSCHGPDNLGAGEHFPALAGQHAGYIADQLRAWQSGDRKNDPQHLMLAIAERLDENDILAVAAWLAQQPAVAGSR